MSRLTFLPCLTLLAALFLGSSAPLQAQRLEIAPSPQTSLIRVNATLQSYNFLRPWEKGAPTPRRGLGAVLEGNRVVVTAELVVNSTYIELELPENGEKAPARIVGLDYEANLALLEPDDPASGILKNKTPLKLTTDVKLRDNLEVWQVEDNGDGIVTDGEVLRVAVGDFFVDGSVFLVYQLKGSLQSRANSFTLPVIKEGKLAGLLLSYNSKEQTSEVMSGVLIKHFLEDLEDDNYEGFPHLGLAYAQTLDEQLRKYAGIDEEDGGVFVRTVAKDGSAEASGIKEGDIIMALGGQPIDSRGNYVDPVYGKINFSHLVRGAGKVGDTIKADIIRDSEPMTIDIKLARKPPEEFLIDPYMFDRGPKFMIVGGLIFQELTLPYLQSWGDQWDSRAPFKLVYAQANPEEYEEEGREKLVFLSQSLRTPSTLGYEELNHIIVTKVNGKEIGAIKDLAEALQSPQDGIHKIEFSEYPKVIYVDAKLADTINQQLIQFGIGQMARLD